MTTRRISWPRRIALAVGGLLVAAVATLLVIADRGITLRTQTVVSLNPERTWEFFADIQNLARWDRSVARVEPTSPPPYGVGSTLDTVSPDGVRSSYRVSEYLPGRSVEVDLVDSPNFRRASWVTRVEPVPEGTRVVFEIEFSPHPQYAFLVPVLYLSQGNLDTDMQYLDAALEEFGRR
jgi:hypothetical protein